MIPVNNAGVTPAVLPLETPDLANKNLRDAFDAHAKALLVLTVQRYPFDPYHRSLERAL
jgi:hypothetical protein